MPTQMGYIDLSATNSVMLAAEAGWSSDLEDYATKADLTVSANKIKSEVSETYATKIEVQRTDTGSGTVVTSDDAANLPPLSLTIHGKSVQDGTPSPSSPVEIRSVEGKNLQSPLFTSTRTVNGVTYTPNEDGTFTASGTATPSHSNVLSPRQYLPAGDYVISGCPQGGAGKTYYLSALCYSAQTGGTLTATAYDYGSGAKLTVPSGGGYVLSYCSVYKDTAAPDAVWKPMLERGSAATAYQPYQHIKVAISGKNLLDTSIVPSSYAQVSYTNGSDGSIVLNGTKYGGGYYVVKTGLGLPLEGTYTLHATQISGTATNRPTIYLMDSDGNVLASATPTSGNIEKVTFTTDAVVAERIRFGLFTDNAVYTDAAYRIWLTAGSELTEYEQYVGSTVLIDLDGNAALSVPDGTEDTLAIDSEGNVTLTKRAGEVTFDGSEGFTWTALTTASSSLKAFLIRATSGSAKNWSSVFGESTLPIQSTAVADRVNVLTNRLQPSAQHYNAWTSPQVIMWGDASAAIIIAIDESITTSAQVNTWLASNPLTVVYKLNTPQTISLGKIDLPALPSPSFSMHVDAAVTPTLDAEWWTQGGEEVGSVYQRTSALEQDAEGFSVRMRGLETDSVRKSKDEWTAWLDVGTDSDNNPFLAMGQSGNDLNSRLSNESMGFYNGTEELMKLSGADGVKADTVRSKRVYIGSWILEELDSGDMAIKLVGGE